MRELGIENLHIHAADTVTLDWLRDGMREPMATLATKMIVAYEYSKQRSVTVDGWTSIPNPQEIRAFLAGDR